MDYYFIGDPELATAFRFIGIPGSAISSRAEAVAAFRRLTEGYLAAVDTVLPGAESCRVLILTEEAADWLGEELIEWQLSGRYPLVVEIPGLMGKLPGRPTLVDAIREAIGVRV